MDYHYVCVHPFGKYVKGQMITDAEEADEVLQHHEHRFVRIAIPAAPAPTVILSEPVGPEAFAPSEAGGDPATQPWPAPQNPKRSIPRQS
jgi:hypothetical protein